VTVESFVAAVEEGGVALSEEQHVDEGNMLFWLLSIAMDGTLANSVALFKRGIELTDRLAMLDENFKPIELPKVPAQAGD
jgi:hypothetical protein